MKKYPLLFDMHAHFRTPGQEYKEDINTGTASANAGGYFGVCTMPNTIPVIDNPEQIKRINENGVDVYQISAITKGLTSSEFVDFDAMKNAGAIAFSNDGVPVYKEDIAKQAMQEAYRVGLPMIEHCEDTGVANWQGQAITYKEYLDLTGEESEDYALDAKLWYGNPNVESNMVERDCKLSYKLNVPIHLAHISCKRSIEIIEKYKDKGAKITCETAPHYISLDATATIAKGAMAKMNPPLRSKADVIACRNALKTGIIDCIATDHAPHADYEKASLEKSCNGIIGLETAFSVCYTYLVKTGILTLDELFGKMSINPAKIMNIAIPSDRHLEVLDEPIIYKTFKSKASNSPYIAEQLWGNVKIVS